MSNRKLFIILLFWVTNLSLFGQSFENDMKIINLTDFNIDKFQTQNHVFLLPNTNAAIIKYNPASLFLGSLMYVYQSYFSNQIFADCLFKPSCSNMSKQFIKEFGIIKGVFLTADRLTRCNRIAATDVHKSRIDEIDHKIHEDVSMFRFKTNKK